MNKRGQSFVNGEVEKEQFKSLQTLGRREAQKSKSSADERNRAEEGRREEKMKVTQSKPTL